ncbi:hypothetical protein QAD02_006303 [Eretmocerus hayati]|uniref:Uncharacterized protein n=1 Tax=Eretmocerus hayati TaxID=131215 RepID=A0ACC2N0W1_9HYME|nr:hypothetical protein QAD02_006303 [Eretmocerus hayati]
MKPKRTTPKMSGLVVAALRNLRDAHGSTAKEIMKYIMAEYNASEATVQRQLKTALKRGVEYGILKKTNAGYSLNTDAEVIGPVEACKKKKPKRAACGKPKPKRTCKKKKKKPSCPKKKKKPSCPKKKKKKNPCNVCATRGKRGDCAQPVQLVRDGTPSIDDDQKTEAGDKRSQVDEDEQAAASSRSRSTSKGPRSRSQSIARSRQSSDYEDDRQDED